MFCLIFYFLIDFWYSFTFLQNCFILSHCRYVYYARFISMKYWNTISNAYFNFSFQNAKFETKWRKRNRARSLISFDKRKTHCLCLFLSTGCTKCRSISSSYRKWLSSCFHSDEVFIDPSNSKGYRTRGRCLTIMNCLHSCRGGCVSRWRATRGEEGRRD